MILKPREFRENSWIHKHIYGPNTWWDCQPHDCGLKNLKSKLKFRFIIYFDNFRIKVPYRFNNFLGFQNTVFSEEYVHTIHVTDKVCFREILK